jgi:hypothetical protein
MSSVFDILLPSVLGAGFEPGITLNVDPMLQLMKLDSVSVAVAVEVLNGTRHALIPVGVTANRGVVESAPMPVAPSVGEVFIARKNRRSPLPFCGTFGSATWRIGETENYLTVGWSAPYNHAFFSNWLMVAVNDKPLVGKEAFKQLYYQPQESWCQRKEFSKAGGIVGGGALRLRTGGHYVFATMGSRHKSVASVTLLPEAEAHLAPNVRRFVDHED